MPLRLESSCASSKMRRLASVATRASCCSGVAVAGALVERLRGDPRRDLTRLRTAHPVRDRVHGRPRVVRVLVGVALAPGIGTRRLVDDPQHEPHIPAVCLQTAGLFYTRPAACGRTAGYSLLEPELRVPDPDHVPGRSSCWAPTRAPFT